MTAHPRLQLAAALGAIVACAALLGRVGADARWLAALGQLIAAHHQIPHGIPFAVAPTDHWANAPVLAELAFGMLERMFGDRGLMLAQLMAVALAMGVLARDARAGGATTGGVVVALLLTALATLPSLAIARGQMFSLVLFPVLVALLRTQARSPDRRIWLVVPLLALWSNLHGAAILGLGVVLAYLALVRFRAQPRLTLAIAAASILALGLTPALTGTLSYYQGLITNVAAQRGAGMWGPLSLTAPFDVLLVACAIAFAVRLRHARPPMWELVVAGVLAVAAVRAERNGVWLVFLLAPRAATVLAPVRRWPGLALATALASVAAVLLCAARGPIADGASPAMVARAVSIAHGGPVLAGGGIDEQIALAGGRVWAGDPIDAFSRSDQASYLDWLDGERTGDGVLARVGVVLVQRNTPAARLMAGATGFVPAGTDRTTELYQRVGGVTRG